MFALCVEASHARGMGHVFRSLVLADTLIAAGHKCTFYLNDHAPTVALVVGRGHAMEIVPLLDPRAEWEAEAVRRDGIDVWVNDRHGTDALHASRIKTLRLPLVTFDDGGSGAAMADLHIAGMTFDTETKLHGRRVLRGFDYLVLNPDIAHVRRLRTAADSLLVTLGGADTHGVTVEVVRHLAAAGRPATVVIGPAFRHRDELALVVTPNFQVKTNVASLIEEFSRHDLAITGGGLTPLEACASGLPCIVVANEAFEIPRGRALEQLGAAIFAGHRSHMDPETFVRSLPIEAMSKTGLDCIGLEGTRRVIEALLAL